MPVLTIGEEVDKIDLNRILSLARVMLILLLLNSIVTIRV